MRFFDYIFYSVSALYKERKKAWDPKYFGFITVSLIQTFSIGLALTLISIVSDRNLINDYKLVFKIILAIPFIFNLYRYFFVVSFGKLESRWGYENVKIRRSRVRLTFILLVICVILAFWVGAINRKVHVDSNNPVAHSSL